MKEGFLNKFFNNKKENEYLQKINTLKVMLTSKGKEVEELTRRLESLSKESIDTSKNENAFKRQLEIIQKNLLDRDNKNKQLLEQLTAFNSENKTLKEELEFLKEETRIQEKQNKQLEKKIQDVDINISRIVHENSSLKTLNEQLEDIISNNETQIIGEVSLPEENILDNKETNFRVPIEILFDPHKFKGIFKILISLKIIFVDEISMDSIYDTLKEKVNLDEVYEFNKIYTDYQEGRIPWDIKTHITMGPRLTKMFSRQRKLLNLFKELHLEFLIELDNFDESLLSTHHFTEKQIDSYHEALKEYSLYRS